MLDHINPIKCFNSPLSPHMVTLDGSPPNKLVTSQKLAEVASKVLTRSKTMMVLWSDEKDNRLDVHIAGPIVRRSADQLSSAPCEKNSSKVVILRT